MSTSMSQSRDEAGTTKSARHDSGMARVSPLSSTRLTPQTNTTRSTARKKRRRRRRLVVSLLFLTIMSSVVGWWGYTRYGLGTPESAALTAIVQRRDFASSDILINDLSSSDSSAPHEASPINRENRPSFSICRL